MTFCFFFNLFCHLKIHVFFVLTLLPFSKRNWLAMYRFIYSGFRRFIYSVYAQSREHRRSSFLRENTGARRFTVKIAGPLPPPRRRSALHGGRASSRRCPCWGGCHGRRGNVGACCPSPRRFRACYPVAAAAPGAQPDTTPGGQATAADVADDLPQPPMENRGNDV